MKSIKPEELKDLLKTCSASLVEFRRRFLDNEGAKEVESADFQHAWSRSLLTGKENEAIEAFRESGKSQLVLRAFPISRLTFPSRDCNYIVLIKSNATQAAKVLRQIAREHHTNPLCSFNLLETLEESGQVYHTVNLDQSGKRIEVRIEAYGKGQSIRGLSWGAKRPDVIVIDDPQDREEARSDIQLENDWEWFLSDIKFLGNEGGSRIFLIGNNLGDRCIIERVMANPDLLSFKCSRIPRINNGVLAWPARDTVESIDKLKTNYAKLGQLNIFYEEVLCQSIADENKLFKEEDFRYFNLNALDLSKLNICAALDPASSVSDDSCYRSISVVGVDSKNQWFLLDNPYGRWNSSDLIEKIFETVKKFKLLEFGIEKGIFEQFLRPFLEQEMKRKNVFFNVRSLEHAKRGSKLERIKMLEPRFKAHTIYFPDDYPEWLGELKSELNGVTRSSIKSQFIDLVDSLAMIDQIASVPFFGIDDDEPFSNDIAPMQSAF